MALKGTCDVCGEPSTRWKRCDSHYVCDNCGLGPDGYGVSITYTSIGLLCDDCHKIKIEERIRNFNRDTIYEPCITCPYCGEVYADSWEYIEGGDVGIECYECGNTFALEIVHDVSYTTRKKETQDEQEN